MVVFQALLGSLLLSLVAADECPALSNTFGQKPKNLFDLTTVDCRVGIQAAECATNLRNSYGQTWAAFRINHNKDCNHGAPYGDCCCFAGKPPVDPGNLEPNPSVWLFFWDDIKTGQNPGVGTQCIQDPTNGCCGRQDSGKFTVTGGCPYPPSTVKDAQGNLIVDQYGRVGDGCVSKGGGGKQITDQSDPNQQPPTEGTETDSSGNGGSGEEGSGGDSPSGGGRFARFKLFRRQSSKKKSPTPEQSGGGGGGKKDDRYVVSGSGPGGFPKCGPRGNFGPAKQCQKDIKAMCKPGVKNKGTGGNMGKMPKGGTGDLDGTTCPNGKNNAGGLRGSSSSSPKEGDPAETQQNSQDAESANTRMRRRWASIDSAELLKRGPGSGGNQFDGGNVGQLSPKGKCCWCQAEKGSGGGGGKKKGGK